MCVTLLCRQRVHSSGRLPAQCGCCERGQRVLHRQPGEPCCAAHLFVQMLRWRPLSKRCMHMSGAESTCWAWQGQTWYNAWQPYFSLNGAAPYLDSTAVGGVSPPDDMYLYQSMCAALCCSTMRTLRYSIAACHCQVRVWTRSLEDSLLADVTCGTYVANKRPRHDMHASSPSKWSVLRTAFVMPRAGCRGSSLRERSQA